jgi:hypothetical protein
MSLETYLPEGMTAKEGIGLREGMTAKELS